MKLAQKVKLSGISLVGIAGMLLAVYPAPASAATGTNIQNEDGWCIGVPSGSDPVWVGQYICTSNPDQLWVKSATVDGHFYIQNDAGQCLAAATAGVSNGTKVVASNGGLCGTRQSEWVKGACSPTSGSCAIKSEENTSIVIGVSGASTKTGAHLVLWTANGEPNQGWNWSGIGS
jgi:hypothetical protein